MIDTQAAVTALHAEHDKLVHQLAELGATPEGDLTGDLDFGEGFADAAAATAERSELLGIVENLRTMLAEVKAALGRIESGTYGRCEACGDAIGADRMEFRPTSRFCVDCKSKRAAG